MGFADLGVPVRNAAELAIETVNAAGGVGGARIVLDEYDDGGEEGRGTATATAMVADPRTVAIVGPGARAWDSR